MADEAIDQFEESFHLERRAIQILDIVVAEWESDPQAVQCFDLRIVKEAGEIIKRLKKIHPNVFRELADTAI